MMKGVFSVIHRNNMATLDCTLHPRGQRQLQRGTEREVEKETGRVRDRARERDIGRRREIT